MTIPRMLRRATLPLSLTLAAACAASPPPGRVYRGGSPAAAPAGAGTGRARAALRVGRGDGGLAPETAGRGPAGGTCCRLAALICGCRERGMRVGGAGIT